MITPSEWFGNELNDKKILFNNAQVRFKSAKQQVENTKTLRKSVKNEAQSNLDKAKKIMMIRKKQYKEAEALYEKNKTKQNFDEMELISMLQLFNRL
jgi:hypothetical protein